MAITAERWSTTPSATTHTIPFPTGTEANDLVFVFVASPDTPNYYPAPTGWNRQGGGVSVGSTDFGAHMLWKFAEADEDEVVLTSTVSLADSTPAADGPLGYIVRVPEADYNPSISTLLSSNTNSRRGFSQASSGVGGTYTLSFDPIDSRPLTSASYLWLEFIHFESAVLVSDGPPDGLTAHTNPSGWAMVDEFRGADGDYHEHDWVVLYKKWETAATVTPANITLTDGGYGQENHVISVGVGILADAPTLSEEFIFIPPTARRRVDVKELPYAIHGGMLRGRHS
jgi:hypothetical protein